MSENRRILILSRSLPFHAAGGMEHVAWDLSRALVRAGQVVTVLTTSIPGRPPTFSEDGVGVVTAPGTAPGRYSRTVLGLHARLVSPPGFRCGGRTQCQRRSLRSSRRAGAPPRRSLPDAGAWNLGRRNPGEVERTRNPKTDRLGSERGLVVSRPACVPSASMVSSRWDRGWRPQLAGWPLRTVTRGERSDPDRQRHRNGPVQAGRRLAPADARRPGMESRRRRGHHSQSPARA